MHDEDRTIWETILLVSLLFGLGVAGGLTLTCGEADAGRREPERARARSPRPQPISDAGIAEADSGYPLPAGEALVVVETGQSNMSGGTTGAYAAPALSTTQPFDNQKWTGTDFTDLIEPFSGANDNESPTSGLANWITDAESDDSRVIYTYNWAQPGASIATIEGGTTPYNNAVIELGQMHAALGATPHRYVLTGQHGEADDNVTPTYSASQYAAEMVELQDDWQTSMRASAGASASVVVPFVYGQIGQWPLFGASVAPYRSHVAQGQWFAARDNPTRIFLAAPTYQLPYQVSGTNVHLTNVGERRLGEYIGKAARRVAVLGSAWLPLHMSGATATDNVVTVQLAGGDGSNIAVDTTQMVGRHTRGFEYTDDSGSPAAITSVAINAAARTVALTLNKDAVSGATVRYGLTAPIGALVGGAPTGTPLGISTGGNLRDSDTTASRVAGHPALQNWLIVHAIALSSFTSVTPVSEPSWSNTQSLRLTGTDFVQITEADETEGDTAVTWHFLVRHDTSWPSTGVILQKAITGHTQWDFRANSSGRMTFYIYTGASSTADLTTANTTFAGNTWYPVVVVYNGAEGTANNRLRVYVGGSDISASGTYTGTMPTSLRTGSRCALMIGASGNDTTHFGSSNIRDIAIWSGVAATAEQVTELYNAGTEIDPATTSLGQPTHHYRLESDFADYGSAPRHGLGYRSATFNATHP